MIPQVVSVAGHTLTARSHKRWHLDELCALWFITKYATIEFIRKYCRNNELDLGIGGGPFDEHPTNGQKRKEGKCCADLVAEALGVAEDPKTQPILDYVRAHDLEGKGQPWDLADIVSAMNFCWPDEPEKVLGWLSGALEVKLEDDWRSRDFGLNYLTMIMTRTCGQESARAWYWIGLEAKHRQQEHFFTVTRSAYETCWKQVETIQGPKESLALVTIESDDELIAKYAMSEFGDQADVVLACRSTGHFQLFAPGVKLDELIKLIRLYLQVRGGQPLETDWRVLTAEGSIPGAECIHYFPRGRMILNGSFTHDKPPANIPRAELQRMVRVGLNPQVFESTRAKECRQGTCSSQPDHVCPWHKLRLARCWQIQTPEQRLI